MAEDAPEREDATEEPTPKRLQKAREEGQVPLSREATSLVVLIAAMLAAFLSLPSTGGQLLIALRGLLAEAHARPPAAALAEVASLSILVLLPVAGAAAVAAIAVTLLQTGGAVSAKGMVPRLAKLSPLAGLKRLFGQEGLVELARTFVKLGVVGVALWFSFGAPESLQAVLHRPPAALLEVAQSRAAALIGAAVAAYAALAAADLFWVRLQHRRQLRMTRQELKEELKESEGDPQRKGQLRKLRDALRRGRMLARVPQAAVVITNPTHYAVALAYREGTDAAPKVVAKGVDEVAARIREAARAAGVPIVSNPPLARALHRLDLDAQIPPEHFQAVAEIIAFVWRAKRRLAG